jgi:hypothetical protein
MTRRYLPGDVAISYSHSFVGWAIRLGTRSRYNHTRLVVDHAGGTLEAMSNGAIWGHVHQGDIVLRPPLTEEQRARVHDVATQLHGTPYGFLGVVALGLAQFGIMLPWVRTRIQRRDELFCSQLVDYAWYRCGFNAYKDGRVPMDVSPGDLGDLAFRSGWKVITA